MSKRARYDGPFNEVVVRWPPGETGDQDQWSVKQGALLPAEAPAKLRDELTASEYWTEVEQSATSSSKKDEEG